MTISTEEEYKNAKKIFRDEPKEFKTSKFAELEKLVKDALDSIQDSDRALILITK